ncbi:GGDEF domain-containing protein [Verminephrobacter eiseniae]|uniref:GGDEF domain-containing protein n=1 Tax=Verminephrobacter eiseniae TaxID=364317 RepID=UPI0010D7C2F2|nr:GGDEF domain-containing protein [Verminephrobacter eiseniae]KAB7628051.1 GGDEF domain-containing protein [Verminephrobacter sp. Larva24]MCW5231188.1 GGDEF domain-containing protein [Verminephrobacter eiseniae]MCW5292919.1 GGDEF domain-containing protein [Verminephrobacter eiseniae]MCW8185840.1 GGDEF domain-containing protein [Verminephrobacter eiseniae]MCW8224611.1 GGDEF domain-containing protein [Verminephrobacter eiseniae]
MSDSAASSFVDLRDLRLDAAHALLAQAGGYQTAWHGATAPARYLQGLIDGLCELSLLDPLTGLASRRQLQAVQEREIDRVTRSGETALLLMLAIDHFKPLSDRPEHRAGAMVLQSVARTLSACLRPMDTLARCGDAAFAVVLPACHAGFGQVVAERIRRVVANAPIQLSAAVALDVTVSIGGAFALPGLRSTARLWSDRAEQQLAQARSAGCNRISIEAQADSTVSAEEKSLLFGPRRPPPSGCALDPADNAY